MSNSIASPKNRLPAAQLLKYALVGLVSNSCGYALYLVLTKLGTAPKPTMTALYVSGALMSFIGNRRLTFSYHGGVLGSGLRFILAHTGGYAINFSLLAVFVDRFEYPHQWVQAAAILIVAAYLFVTLKFFVFRPTP